MRLILVAATSFFVFATCSPAGADEAYFRTPSGNIYCAYDDFEGTPGIRCDIRAFTPSFTRPPGNCDLDWGDSFAVTATSAQGQLVCHGDTVILPDARALEYGTAFQRGGIVCASASSGLTCSNAAGHGFFLSKAKQRVF